MSFLVDTNILSEVRKGRRADAGVMRWFERTDESALYTSVLVLGEVRQGIENLRGRDARTVRALEQWLQGLVEQFAERMLPVDAAIAERWGELNAPDRLPVVDGLMAATALVHGLTMVSRNSDDFEPTGVRVLNPFDH